MLACLRDRLALREVQLAARATQPAQTAKRVVRAQLHLKADLLVAPSRTESCAHIDSVSHARRCANRTNATYAEGMAFTRISIDHRIMGGVPCIRGTRIPAAMIVRMVANGTSVATLIDEYPQLTEEDVREALRFAAASVDQRTIPLDQPA